MTLNWTGRVLFVLVWIAMVGIVTCRHQIRQRMATLQQLEQEADALHQEWTQLLLEQGTWASHSRIEKIAREALGMKIPEAKEIQVIGGEGT